MQTHDSMHLSYSPIHGSAVLLHVPMRTRCSIHPHKTFQLLNAAVVGGGSVSLLSGVMLQTSQNFHVRRVQVSGEGTEIGVPPPDKLQIIFLSCVWKHIWNLLP